MWHMLEWTNTLPHENALFWVFGTKGSIVRRALLSVLKFRFVSSPHTVPVLSLSKDEVA